MAMAGIYDPRIHYDKVVMPLVRKLQLFETEGLSPTAETARAELATFLSEMNESAKRLEERRAHKQDTTARG